jgi:hypothetical protein
MGRDLLRGKDGGGVKVTAHLHVLPKLRMGAGRPISAVPHMFSCIAGGQICERHE